MNEAKISGMLFSWRIELTRAYGSGSDGAARYDESPTETIRLRTIAEARDEVKTLCADALAEPGVVAVRARGIASDEMGRFRASLCRTDNAPRARRRSPR